ncbi:hypothetical protein A2890_01920 [candidate division WWE3 bacterium RIFCSPLOWO2_01_FULL_53_14]|uniref:Uncharacterized protein n=1 Tax=candidate division WWE3 bacterium RIFCSPLOWO2_01_FULL_53_14 TaxID=1802628 RepID=A0A1F4VZ13_UNCKA|nr:MAG: hypothetical protein A2890_01920 [candidate division WWE3 bacterium RIFCSPLOWO2_01_FULL_53_14]
MGTNVIPTVADFLKIEPLTPELVMKIGYLPQCTFGDLIIDGHRSKVHCGRESEWTIEGDHYCTSHKDEIVRDWKQRITEWVARPAGAKDSDLELLELIQNELTKAAGRGAYPSFLVSQVVKDLSLSSDPAGRNLAAWYLWEMGIFDIHGRVGFFEQS